MNTESGTYSQLPLTNPTQKKQKHTNKNGGPSHLTMTIVPVLTLMKSQETSNLSQ